LFLSLSLCDASRVLRVESLLSRVTGAFLFAMERWCGAHVRALECLHHSCEVFDAEVSNSSSSSSASFVVVSARRRVQYSLTDNDHQHEKNHHQ